MFTGEGCTGMCVYRVGGDVSGLSLTLLYAAAGSAHVVGRRLLANTSTEAHGPSWEQCDFEDAHTPGIWVFLYIILVLVMFIGETE